MSNSYTLVNPIIIGNLNTTVTASNNAVAAKEIYERLSKYFGKTQKNFVFTIQKIDNQSGGSKTSHKNKPSYYSFKVTEVEHNDQVVFTIGRYGGKVNYNKLNDIVTKIHNKANNNIDHILSETENITMKGGKKNDDDDSFNELLDELDTEEFELKKRNKYKQELVFPRFYIPTLVDPISYYWYANVYADLNHLLIPSFIPTLSNTRIMIDLVP